MQPSKAHRKTNMSNQSTPAASDEIAELHGYLTRTNQYFALWDLYKRVVSEHPADGEWEQFLREQLGPESEEDVEFGCAMVELEKLLAVYHEHKRALPMLSFERICFLHLLRGPERMAQTRAILGTLTVELTSCTSG